MYVFIYIKKCEIYKSVRYTMRARYIKKGKCMSKLGIIFKNQNFCKKFFDSDS